MELAGLRTDIAAAVEVAPPHWVDDDALVALAQQYEPLSLERFADGKLLVTPLTEFRSGIRSATLTAEIANWAEAGDCGFVAASPIASESEREFPVLVPDAVFELLSDLDCARTTTKKVRAYLRNGVALVVLIDPYRRRIHIGRPGDEKPRDLGVVDRFNCSPMMPGFVLDVAAILTVR